EGPHLGRVGVGPHPLAEEVEQGRAVGREAGGLEGEFGGERRRLRGLGRRGDRGGQQQGGGAGMHGEVLSQGVPGPQRRWARDGRSVSFDSQTTRPSRSSSRIFIGYCWLTTSVLPLARRDAATGCGAVKSPTSWPSASSSTTLFIQPCGTRKPPPG